MGKPKVEIKINDRAARKLADDALSRNGIEGLEVNCPKCGAKVPVTGKENVCECGFILRARLG